MIGARQFPVESPLSPWRNRLQSTVISFDKTPEYVAAQTTIVDTSATLRDGVELYENVAIISIDEKTIEGKQSGRGSKPIYNRAQAEENYRLYMTDGLLYSIAHEFLHTYLDQRNSVSALADAVVRNQKIKGGADAEEVLVAHTTLEYMRELVSAEVRADAVRRQTAILKSSRSRDILRKVCALASAESGATVKFSCPPLT